MLLWGSRYFEEQAPGGKFGQHALNNLIGGPQFDDAFMEEAFRLVMEELPHEPAALHRRGAGWYSHSVLAKALDVTCPALYRLLFRPVASCGKPVAEVRAALGSRDPGQTHPHVLSPSGLPRAAWEASLFTFSL